MTLAEATALIGTQIVVVQVVQVAAQVAVVVQVAAQVQDVIAAVVIITKVAATVEEAMKEFQSLEKFQNRHPDRMTKEGAAKSQANHRIHVANPRLVIQTACLK